MKTTLVSSEEDDKITLVSSVFFHVWCFTARRGWRWSGTCCYVFPKSTEYQNGKYVPPRPQSTYALKTTLETGGEDVGNTLETSGED